MFLFLILPSVHRGLLRREALHILNFMDNFVYVDKIIITLNSEVLFETNEEYYNFEEVKTTLSPFEAGWSSYTTKVRRDILKQSIEQNISIEYLIEDEIFFTINIFILSSPPFSVVVERPLNNEFFIAEDFYGVAFINGSATMVRFNSNNFEDSLIKQIIYESLFYL